MVGGGYAGCRSTQEDRIKQRKYVLLMSVISLLGSQSRGTEPGFAGHLPQDALTRSETAIAWTTNAYHIAGLSLPSEVLLAGEALCRPLIAEEADALRQFNIAQWPDGQQAAVRAAQQVAVFAYYNQTGDDAFLISHMKPELGFRPYCVLSVTRWLPANVDLRVAVLDAVVENAEFFMREGSNEHYESFCHGVTQALIPVDGYALVHELKPRLDALKLSPNMAMALIRAMSETAAHGDSADEVRTWMQELFGVVQDPLANTALAASLLDAGQIELQEELVGAKRTSLERLLQALSDEAIAELRSSVPR